MMAALPFRDCPSTASTQTQSSQTDDIFHSDAYLSARKFLDTARELKARASSTESVVADAAIIQSRFADLLARLTSDISASGRYDFLSDVMLPRLAHLVTLIEEIHCISTSSNITHSTTASTTTSLRTTNLAFRPHSAESPASPASVSVETIQTADATTVPTASTSTTALAFRSHPANLFSSSTPVSNSILQTFRFSSLPPESKVIILFHVPEKGVALNRRLFCRELRDLINSNEPHIAELTAEREYARTRSQISMRTQVVPSNLTDLVSHARLWIRLRGFCPDEPSIAIDFSKTGDSNRAHVRKRQT
jgi:hypothetical protein